MAADTSTRTLPSTDPECRPYMSASRFELGTGEMLALPQRSYSLTGSDLAGADTRPTPLAFRSVATLSDVATSPPSALSLTRKLSLSVNTVDAFNGTPLTTLPTGLANSGNQCFINCVLQCLAFTPPLLRFFGAGGNHEAHINRTNPLGHGGMVAATFAQLVQELWSGRHKAITPDSFLKVLEQAASHLDPRQQHDAQEFLAFLMDGLHEDLNRVTERVYEPLPALDGCRDMDAATATWEHHQRHNRSIMVDTCQGLLRSQVTCPNCAHTSVKFDPFMHLSLPLPECAPNGVHVTLTEKNGVRHRVYATVDGQRTFHALREAIHRTIETKMPLVFAAVINKHITRLFRLEESLDALAVGERLYAYECAADSWDTVHVPVTMYAPATTSSPHSLAVPRGASTQAYEPMCHPLLLAVPRQATPQRMCAAVHGQLSGILTLPTDAPLSPTPSSPVPPDTPPASPRSPREGRFSFFGFKRRAAFELWEGWTTGERVGPTSPHSPKERRWWPLRAMAWAQDSQAKTSSSTTFSSSSTTGHAPDMAAPPHRASTPNSDGPKTHRYQPHPSPLPISQQDETAVIDMSHKPHLALLWTSDQAEHLCGDIEALCEVHEHGSVATAREEMARGVNLSDCFDQLLKEEVLCGADSWYCPKCKAHVSGARKKMALWRLPPVLTIHLKRFAYVGHKWRKLDSPVAFPIRSVDFSRRLDPQVLEGEPRPGPLYDLYGLVQHMGTMDAGHYNALCRHPATLVWHCLDDSLVTPVGAHTDHQRHAYLLFYIKREQPLPTPPQPPPPAAAREPMATTAF